jgi:hypothetical protein
LVEFFRYSGRERRFPVYNEFVHGCGVPAINSCQNLFIRIKITVLAPGEKNEKTL